MIKGLVAVVQHNSYSVTTPQSLRQLRSVLYAQHTPLLAYRLQYIVHSLHQRLVTYVQYTVKKCVDAVIFSTGLRERLVMKYNTPLYLVHEAQEMLLVLLILSSRDKGNVA